MFPVFQGMLLHWAECMVWFVTSIVNIFLSGNMFCWLFYLYSVEFSILTLLWILWVWRSRVIKPLIMFKYLYSGNSWLHCSINYEPNSHRFWSFEFYPQIVSFFFFCLSFTRVLITFSRWVTSSSSSYDRQCFLWILIAALYLPNLRWQSLRPLTYVCWMLMSYVCPFLSWLVIGILGCMERLFPSASE